MAAPAQTTPDAQDPSAPADPIALAAFVSRRGGRVLAYLDAVTAPDRALRAAGDAFAAFRLARAADPDAEAAATTLLRATRRAATAHAENPYRPVGRERPARRTAACEAMPRLLVAWTEARLPDQDVERLVEHLQGCPDCRALRDAFDRAELGYRGGQSVELDGTEVGVIAAAMALAVTAPPAPESAEVPAAEEPRGRRTAIPAAPDALRTEEDPRRTAPPSGRRTTVPSPPRAAGDRTAIPSRPTAIPERPTANPVRPTTLPGRRTPGTDRPADPSTTEGQDGRPTATPPPRTAEPGTGSSPRHAADAGADFSSPRAGADEPVDPLSPEALGYAVPRAGLPRPGRRPAVPRVRPRRRRRAPSAAVAASEATTPAGPGAEETGTAGSGTDAARPTGAVARQRTDANRDARTPNRPAAADRDPARHGGAPEGPRDATRDRSAVSPARDTPADASPSPDREVVVASSPGRAATKEPSPSPDHAEAGGRPRADGTTTPPPATVTSGGLATTGRRVLEVPLVRQLGVPAVLLLAVLIAALIAAGVFAGQQQETVAPITRPTIPTVPADPSDIPSLR